MKKLCSECNEETIPRNAWMKEMQELNVRELVFTCLGSELNLLIEL